MNATDRNGCPPQAGFTLMELLVVIVIIGLLAGMLVPSVNAARIAAKNVKCRTLINTLDSALHMFKAESRLGRVYPPSEWRVNPIPFIDHPGGDPYENVDPSINFTVAYGAHTLIWALAGADLTGTRGFGDVDTPLDAVYDDANAHRSYGPFVDVSKIAIKTVEQSAFSKHPNFSRFGQSDTRLPVFVDAFNMPILYYRANIAQANISNIYFVTHNEPFTYPMNRPEFVDRIRDDRPFVGSRVHNQDTFLLISAGPDKDYVGDSPGYTAWVDNIANFPVESP